MRLGMYKQLFECSSWRKWSLVFQICIDHFQNQRFFTQFIHKKSQTYLQFFLHYILLPRRYQVFPRGHVWLMNKVSPPKFRLELFMITARESIVWESHSKQPSAPTLSMIANFATMTFSYPHDVRENLGFRWMRWDALRFCLPPRMKWDTFIWKYSYYFALPCRKYISSAFHGTGNCWDFKVI